MSEKYMKVEKIEHGTVIDHIMAGRAFDVIRVLGLGNDRSMSILVNSHSQKGGKKDILKIENVELSDEEANLVALVSPAATINIIANGNVVKKFNVEAPKRIKGILTCSNPNCISNQKEPVESLFHLGKDDEHRYICAYCERDIVNLARQILR
ncbi:MAG: aspartate carbamoyltransferase regulatory subunit [Lysobacterales bacterium]|jgi:aspartate carbamoyltransferase regulatory subunit